MLAEDESVHFCATVTAKDIPCDDDSRRAPVDIIVALDTSGSMRGEKLMLCKETLKLLLRELGPNDRFGLITFGSTAIVQIPVRNITIENKQASITKIQSICVSGQTNLSGGIGLAAQEMNSIKKPNEVRSLFLLTDGHANKGVIDKSGIVQLTNGCLSAPDEKHTERSIPIHCFGYGSDHDGDLLRDISQTNEGGTYYFVGDDSDVSSAFGDALGGVLSVVAQNITITVIAPVDGFEKHGNSLVKIYHENAEKMADGSYKINIVDLYAEESRDILFEVSLACKNIDDYSCVPHVCVSMTYLDTIEKNLATVDSIIGSIDRPEESRFRSPANHRVSAQWLRIKTANVMAESEDIAKNGDFLRAQTVIEEATKALRKEIFDAQEDNALHEQLLSDLSIVHSGLGSPQVWAARGSYIIKSKQLTHKHQRCSEPKSTSINSYRSPKKSAMSKKFSTNKKSLDDDKTLLFPSSSDC
jgi:hypothetical protein